MQSKWGKASVFRNTWSLHDCFALHSDIHVKRVVAASELDLTSVFLVVIPASLRLARRFHSR